MPVLANPKHERFAENIANGLKQVDAYETAGYPRSPSAASQLSKRPEVQQRVQELISEKQAMADEIGDDIDNLPNELSREWLIKTLMKNVTIAQRAEQIAPANKAVELLAELIGLSLKKPGAAAAAKSTDEDDDKKPDLDLNKMSEGIGQLGQILAAKEARAQAEQEVVEE